MAICEGSVRVTATSGDDVTTGRRTRELSLKNNFEKMTSVDRLVKSVVVYDCTVWEYGAGKRKLRTYKIISNGYI